MSGHYQGESAVNSSVGQNLSVLFGPALTFRMWEPFFVGALNANAQAQEAFGTMAGEWQTFVARRLQENMELVQRLAGRRTPEQILAAHTIFWQKAAEDCSKEFTTITQHFARATSATSANDRSFS